MRPEKTIGKPSEFPAKDRPLRDDVRRLSALVGDMLRKQEGEAFFSLVETIRKVAVGARGDDDSKRNQRLWPPQTDFSLLPKSRG